MKNLIIIATVFLSLAMLTSCEKDEKISEQNLPTEIKAYISTHFPNSSITRAKKEKGENELYEITLSNGFKLEFNKKNEIIDIDGNAKLPDSVIPATILSYVNTTYPTNYIIGWEIQANNQEVKLDNKLELVFDMAGKFLRIDD